MGIVWYVKSMPTTTVRIFLLLSLAACATQDIGAEVSAIINADGDDTSTPYLYPQVVSLNEGGCTGTLISPNHVLTAAHCVERFGTGSISFVPDISGGVPAEMKVAIADCHIFPGYLQEPDQYSRIRSEFRPGAPRNLALGQALGDRCGFLNAALFAVPSPRDVAVLQLERPIPHPSVLGSGALGSGSVFVEPTPLIADVSSLPSTVAGTQVGFGSTVASGAGAGTLGVGVRRYKALPSVPTDDDTIAISAGKGDSGGPILTTFGMGPAVLAVASTESTYILPARVPGLTAWVAQQVDRDADGRPDTACGAYGSRGVDPTLTVADDLDGDGYADSEDSCPTVYNPCQWRRDRDGDGTDDDCDACPLDASISDFRFAVSPDGDDDGYPDVCDCSPFPDDFSRGTTDIDGDLVPNTCDNCQSVANPAQENGDGDVFGDACDGCPFIFDNGADNDGDGTPNECDNCFAFPNPDQANCNLDAERANSQPEQGDACDPIPCGETTVSATVRGPFGSRELVTDQLRVRALADDADPVSGDPYASGFRFCPCVGADSDDPAVREFACLGETFTSAGQRTGGCEVGVPAFYDLSNAVNERHPWRLAYVAYDGDPSDPSVTIPTYSPGGGVPLEAILPHLPLDSMSLPPAPQLAATWSLDDETPRWASIASAESSLDPSLQRFPNEDTAGTIHRGVLWTHTPRDGGGIELPASARDLSSHYWSGSWPGPVSVPPPIPCLLHIGPFIDSGACPHCGVSFPSPFIALGGNLSAGFCGTMPIPPLLALPELPLDLGPVIGLDLGPYLPDDELTWLTPAEPEGFLPPQAGPRLVGLDAESLDPRFVFEQTAGGLQPGLMEAFAPCPSTQSCAGETLGRSDWSAPWSAPLAVLSARRGQAFVFGEAGRARVIDLQHPGGSLQYIEALSGGTPIAATYRPQDDALYVVARRQHSPYETMLVRVPADFDSPAQLVFQITNTGTHDRFQLAVAPDGALWLAAGTSYGSHDVCRLEELPGPYWQVNGNVGGYGYLAPVNMAVDARGLSMVVRQQGKEVPLGYRIEDLASGARDCF